MTDNTTPAATAETLPYKNPDLPAGERIADLLSRMTLEEKVGQMMQLDARGGDLEDLIVNKHVGSILHTSPEDLSRAAKTVNEKTRLGIPLIIGDDCIHGYSFWPGATIFPSQLGMAVSWDPDKVKAAGRATAEEVSCTGVHWTFSPVLCIARDTRWGRVDETFGEDPMLIGELASAMVKGYQGGAKAGEALPKNAILACAKHFAGYSETQGGRDASEADLSHRKLESWFLPPFERVAKEGCGTFMLGYESIEGVPVTFNKWLLTDKLRGAWKYNGTLITDWDNVGRSVWEQRVKPDYVHAAADAVKAGNDLVMTTPQFYEGAIEAVKTGLLDESLIDDAVARILALKFRLGLFEDPRLPDAERIKAVIGSAEHQQTNLELARESVALLRNDGALPFAANKAKRIAVVGPLADDAQNQLGDWTGNSGQVSWMPDGQPRDMITTVLDGLTQLTADDCEVVYSRGANVIDLVPDPAGEFYPDGQPRPKIGVSAAVDQAMIDEAVANARQSDLIVAVVGDVVQLVGETCSTATLELLGGQNALLDALAAVSRETGKPMVTVLISSKPQVLPASIVGESSVFAKRVSDPETGTGSILWAPNPGMRGGQAIAEIILGLTSPDAGELRIFGRSPRAAVRSGDVGAMLQNGALLPDTSVAGLLRTVHGLHARPLPLQQVIERSGVEGFLRVSTSRLSGGQAQRVAIARAMVGHPRVVFADEPSGALDQASGHEVMQLLTTTCRIAGAALVVVTHDINVARWCSRLIEIRDGIVHADRRLSAATTSGELR